MNSILTFAKNLNLFPFPLVDVQTQMCAARCIIDANYLGVFEALGKSGAGLTAKQLAQQLDLSAEGTGVLLQALYKLGYVVQRNGLYKTSRGVNTWILDTDRGIPNVLRYQRQIWGRVSELEHCLKTGHPPVDYHAAYGSRSPEQQDAYTRSMDETSRMLIPRFLRYAKIPSRARRLLDIGGAHGNYSRALAGKHPGLKATIFDLPGAIATAKRIESERGSAGTVDYVEGDALKDDLGTDWDVVLLVNVIHLFDNAQIAALLSRIRKALRGEGVLLIQDQFLGLGRFADYIASLVSVNYFTIGGRTYGAEEIRTLLKTAGFQRIGLKRFFGSPTGLFLSRK